ncbi:calcineurin-like phosphoesterase C-terminal domain-containing protein [Olivibacter jilunii]|uniref:calcineurin-like phosphoesterase C-terminal domain-containing protein n=1 Tax=Olivibacter jilunii TaxID=985016 RepID=UPI003F5CDD20
MAELFYWDETEELFKGRRPTEPANCTHLWRGRLPSDIGVGKHEVDVRMIDMYGKKQVNGGGKASYEPEQCL